MNKYFRCECCSYSSHRLYDFNKHVRSKKHVRNLSRFERQITQNNKKIQQKIMENNKIKSKESASCEYCSKKFTRKDSLNRHYLVCKVLKKEDEQPKSLSENDKKNQKFIFDLIDMLKQKETQLNNQISKKEEAYKLLLKEKESAIKKEQKEKKEIMKELNKLLKNSKTIEYSKMNDGKPITAKHVRENFRDAYHFDEIMDKPLDKEEEKMLETYGPIKGCTKLIQKRCIDGIKPDKRCIHCIDGSRSKFMINVNGKWVTDNSGRKILPKVIKKIEYVFEKMNKRIIARLNKKMRPKYIKKYEKDNEENEIEDEKNSEDVHYDALINHEIQKQLHNMKDDKNWGCILRRLTDVTLLSNVLLQEDNYMLIGEDTKQIKD